MKRSAAPPHHVQRADTVVSPHRNAASPGLMHRCRPAAGAAATAVFLACSTLLAGCAPAAADPPKIFVIVASATANEPAPVLSGQERTTLSQAGSSSTHAEAYVVGPNTDQARAVPLTPRRSDGEVDYGPDRDSRLAANVTRVQQLLNTLAARKPFDLLTMIFHAVQVSPGPGTILVLSSGLSTAGVFDLRQVGWGASPHAAAASLRRRKDLPDLAGWRVVFAGLANAAGRQPALPLPQRTALTRYWLALCRAAGAASCTLDTVTRPEPQSRSTTPVPVVPVPRVTSYRHQHSETFNVPADTFFTFGSARLLPAADPTLEMVAARARRLHLKVTIVGYSSPDGNPSYNNRRLSARRARSVRSRLIALDVPPNLIVKAIGRGTAGRPRSACLRQGHLDETICAHLRRVMITLHSAHTRRSYQ